MCLASTLTYALFALTIVALCITFGLAIPALRKRDAQQLRTAALALFGIAALKGGGAILAIIIGALSFVMVGVRSAFDKAMPFSRMSLHRTANVHRQC